MSKFKIILSLLTLVAIAIWIHVSWSQFSQAFELRDQVILWILVLQIPLQVASTIAVAYFYYSYFKKIELKSQLIKIKDFIKIALELNFVNTVYPSGGVSGFSYLSLRLRPLGIKVSSSTLAQSLRFGLTFLSFLILLGLGLFWLALDGKVNNLVILLASSIFFLTIFGILLFVFLISHKQRIKSFIAWLPKTINKLAQVFRYKPHRQLIDLDRVERALEEVHHNYKYLMKNKKILIQPFFFAFLINFFELLTIYVVFLAFGVSVNPGSIILAYAVANFAGLIVILPGGIGVYEFLMIEVLKIGAVEAGLATAITIVFRIVNFILLIPIGLILYYVAIYKNHIKLSSSLSKAPSQKSK